MSSKVKGPKIHITRTIITMSPKDDEEFELPDLDGLFGKAGFLGFIPKAALVAGRRLSPELDMRVKNPPKSSERKRQAALSRRRLICDLMPTQMVCRIQTKC